MDGDAAIASESRAGRKRFEAGPTDTPDCAPQIADALEALIDERRRAGDPVETAAWRRRLVDAATRKMAAARGVSVQDWTATDDEALGDVLDAWPVEVWLDPHALGWIHEQYAAAARKKSFADHVHREQKHLSSTVTTQLYTPRWIADVLAQTAIDRVDKTAPTVVDPAVGAGQMLLASMAVFADANPGASVLSWVRPLWGIDLDGDVVDIARRTIALEVARRTGERHREVESILKHQLVAGDGLEAAIGPERWDIALTNPPFMGWRSMPDELRERLDPRFRPYHRDLYSAFIARCHELADRAVGILAQQSIWYIRRFEKARRDLLERGHLSLFMHLGPGAFWNLDGEKASVVAFVQSSESASDKSSATRIVDLRGETGSPAKRRAVDELSEAGGDIDADVERRHFLFDVASTAPIPGRPMCHDLRPELRRLFADMRSLDEVADIPGGQHKTGRNRKYVKSWDDVDPETLRSVKALGSRGHRDGRWVFYSKGGRFAPWWGNWQWVVDWSDQARNFYDQNRNSNLLSRDYWFRQGIVYTDFGGRRFNARWMPPGCVFDMTGPAIFPDTDWWPGLSKRRRIGAALAVLNSSPARRMLRALNPTLHFQVRDVRALPIPEIGEATAAELAGDVWEIIEGLRGLHTHVEDDPLYQCGDIDEAKQRRIIDELQALEADVDRRVCAAYGVERRPIDGARLSDHNAL